MEFDFIPDADYSEGTILTYYQETEDMELNDQLYPGVKGLHIVIGNEIWETKGYDNENENWLEGGKPAVYQQYQNYNRFARYTQ